MVTVRALADMKSKSMGLILQGQVFRINRFHLEKIKDRVEIVKDPVAIISAAIQQLNAEGPWHPDLCAVLEELFPTGMERIRQANLAVDQAAESGGDIEAAISEYRAAWLAGLAKVGPPVEGGEAEGDQGQISRMSERCR